MDTAVDTTVETVDVPSEFINAYIVCARWSSTDGDGTPLDDDRFEMSDEATAALESIAREFWVKNQDLLASARLVKARRESDRLKHLGHDLWLTQNGHGAGFWDGDWQEPEATALDNAAKALRSTELYTDENGVIHTV